MNENTKTTVIILFAVFAFFLLIKFFDVSYPLTVKTTSTSSELSVVGEGKVEVVPDKATINAGVTVQNAATAKDAQNAVTQANNKIIQAVKNLGINEKDVKSSNFSVYPNYSSEPIISGGTQIVGYNANAMISVTVRKISQVPQILTAATEAGANEIQGVNYEVDDPNKAREEARNKAIEKAKQQAQNLAKTLGIRLGKITNIVETTPDGAFPNYRSFAVSEVGMGGSPDIQPGTQTITSTVTLYFEKK